jgi:peptide/nickel transport system substrate-binding protein
MESQRVERISLMGGRDETLRNLVDDYRSERISRREAFKRAVALGIGSSAIAAALLSVRSERVSAAGTSGTAGSLRRLQEEPKQGGTLREGYDLDFSKMDPLLTNWYDPAFSALYENPIVNDPEGNKVPQLAESWEVSEDGKTLTLHLREGLKFHSGAPLTAAVVKDVYDDIKEGGVLNGFFAPVESIDAPDDLTVVVNMAHPYYDILNVIDTGYWSIYNAAVRDEAEAAEAGSYGQSVIDGSGPFTYGEWVPGSHVIVNKWADYPGSIVPYFTNKGPAYLDSIRWTFIGEAAQRAIQIENGEIDTLRGPAPQDIARLQSNPDLNIISLKEWSGYIFGVNFTRTDLDFHEVKMRQALSHAFDREAIVQGLLFGQGEPLYGPITSADRYYTPEVEQFNQYDLDLAKSLVSELGWTPGDDGILEKNGVRLSFSMPVQDESFNKQLGTVIQDQLKQLGVEVQPQILDRGTYFGTLQNDNPDSYFFYYLWPVPIDIVTLFVGSATKGNPNWGQAEVPEVDAAIQAWQNAANEEELAAAGVDFQLKVAELLPTIPLVNRYAFWAARNNVNGYLPHQYMLYPFYNDVWLS